MAAPRGTKTDPLGVDWLLDRFWSKINVGAPDECWEWSGGLRVTSPRSTASYGAFADTTASRVAYVLTYGPIADPVVVRHTCDNATCCNPGHLIAGTQAQNVQDMWDRGRRRKPTLVRDPATGRLLGSCKDEEAQNVSA